MATNVDSIKLKKCNVSSVKCKRINVNSVKAWSAEEVLFNGSNISSIMGGWVDRNNVSVTLSSRSFSAYINDHSVNKIDVTDYSKLIVVVDSFSTGSSRTPFIGLWSNMPGNLSNEATNAVAYAVITKTTTKTAYTIDLSNITGAYYLAVAIGMGGAYSSSYSISSIILE